MTPWRVHRHPDWGLVLALGVTRRLLFSASLATEAPEPEEPAPVVVLADGRTETCLGAAVRPVRDEAKAVGALEEAVARAQDPTRQAITVGYDLRVTPRDLPHVFALAIALQAWGAEGAWSGPLVPVCEWLGGPARFRAGGCRQEGDQRDTEDACALLVAEGALGIVAASCVRADWPPLLARELGRQCRYVLTELEKDLARAATKKGVAQAKRRFKANLIDLRSGWRGVEMAEGPWANTEAKGLAMVETWAP